MLRSGENDLGSTFHKQRRAGKSSLIKAVFKVDVTVRFQTSFFYVADCVMETRLDQRPRTGKWISMSSFVQKITVTSSSMSAQGSNLRPRVRKACGPSGTSSHPALTQVAHLQRDYMLSGREVYFVTFYVLYNQFRICIPASDAITGRLGEGVEEILGMRTGEHV